MSFDSLIPDARTFLGQLAANNSRDWFTAHKADYDSRLKTPALLLADEDKELAAAYGVLGPVGFYRRSVFVVDADGRLAYVHRGHSGSTFRTTDELVEAIREAVSRAA